MSRRRFIIPVIKPGTWQYFGRENRVYYQMNTADNHWSSEILSFWDTPETATRVAELLTELHRYRENNQITEPVP